MATKPKLVVFGNMNMDVLAVSPRFPEAGENIRCSEIKLAPGGKAANQSVAAVRLGGEVTLVAATGSDGLSDALMKNLQTEGVLTDRIRRVKDRNCGMALVVVDDRGENRILSHLGANDLLSPEDVLRSQDRVEAADLVLVQLGIPKVTVEAVIEMCQRLNRRVLVDPTPLSGWFPANIAECDFLLPNETEFTALMDALPHAEFENIILKKGARGGEWIRGSERVAYPAFAKVRALDTTGAGDCFAAAFAVELAKSGEIQKALRFASVASALATTQVGAQAAMPRLDAVVSEMNTWTGSNHQ